MTDYLEKSAALGNTLWLRRDRELGLSRERFARATGWTASGDRTSEKQGLSPATIARIERGQRGVPNVREFNLLARALDLTPRQLMGRITQAGSVPTIGEADDLTAAITSVPDAEQRAILERIATDLAGLARRLARPLAHGPVRGDGP